MAIKGAKTYEVYEYDQYGDGTRVWYAKWDGGDQIIIYVGTSSENEILIKRLQNVGIVKGLRKNMKVNEFHQAVSEFIESLLEAEKVTGQQWSA